MIKDKEKILDLIEEIVFKDGYQNLVIDSVSSSIKMSKKTIYKYFHSKDELFLALINRLILQINKEIEQVLSKDIHVVEKIFLSSDILIKVCEKFTNNLIAEVHYHYPSIWERIDEFQKKMIYKKIFQLFSQGIKEGYVIDIPPLFIVTIYQSVIQSVVNRDFFMSNNYSLKSSIKYIQSYLLNGVLTEKGRKKFKELNKKRNLGIKIQ